MTLKQITDTLTNKAPKLILIIVLLFGLGLNKDQILGYSPLSSQTTDLVYLRQVASAYFKDSVSLNSDDNVVFDVTNNRGEALGFLVWSQKFCDDFHGYGGPTPVAIFLDDKYVITDVEMLANSETGRFVARVKGSGLLNGWVGRHILDETPSVQAVSGATYTSNSVIGNVDAALAYVSEKRRAVESTWRDNLIGQIAVLLVLALALFCCFTHKRIRGLRLVVLGLSIVVLGVWQGAFVSLDLIYKWAINGTSFTERFGLIAVLLSAVVVPLIFSRAFYCNFLCPFGAVQELIGKLNPHKLNIPTKILRLFRAIRQVFLGAIVILLFINPYFEASEVEPFTIFTIKSVALSVVIIAIIGLVSSIFIQRAWCRLLCPTGELLALLQRKMTWNFKGRKS